MTYENPWTFEDKVVNSEDIQNYEGFVYLITNKTNNRKYVGKKTFWFRRKATKKATRRTTVESDWKDYYGSCEPLTEDILKLGKNNFTREILYLCKHKKSVSYYELKEQFLRDVLTSDEYYNTNIGGKWFATETKKIYEIVERNQKYRDAVSERMTGDNNPSKRPEVKAKLSAALSGQNNPMYGLKGENNPKFGIPQPETFSPKVTGKNHWTYKGEKFITPWGEFDNAYQACKNCPTRIGHKLLTIACTQSQEVFQTKQYKDGGHFKKEDIGKTYKELGFGCHNKENID